MSPTVPIPRIRAEPLASVPVDDTSSEGATCVRSRMSDVPEFSNVAAETAETATGTSASFWARPCAVTMMTLSSTTSSSGWTSALSSMSPSSATSCAIAACGSIVNPAPRMASVRNESLVVLIRKPSPLLISRKNQWLIRNSSATIFLQTYARRLPTVPALHHLPPLQAALRGGSDAHLQPACHPSNP